MKRLASFEEQAFYIFDILLISLSVISLFLSLFIHDPVERAYITELLAVLSFLGLLPVAYSAFKSLLTHRLSVDLLAAIALTFSLLAHEWFSAAFITLMLAFARLFDRITEDRAKKVIQSLMKFHVENVRLKVGDSIKEVHVSQIKKGDLVIVESGDRMPVDGIVESGTADVDESSLTGESELVPKKPGDRVSTATVNESGSLVVRADKVGADSTLSRIVNLIDEASRDKNEAERAADRFTQWYILLSLIASILMFFIGLSPRVILSVLLVVCADDIAVAVPLAFTVAITRAAKRGVLIKGSTVLEQISRMRYMLTDKTGTLTKGKPKIVDVRVYGGFTSEDVVKLAASGASESRHNVAVAILNYAEEKKIHFSAPKDMHEKPGHGMFYTEGHATIYSGRLSFVESEHISISEKVRDDISKEKENGRGISVVGMKGEAFGHKSLSGEVIGVISYADELRPHVKEIIAETKSLGVKEWHMLTGDNEKAAAAVAKELDIKHYHANLTPEGKVEFLRKFEKEFGHKHVTVGYIGDGVNDAASLALADVSIAMGGIGSDAAIEAADITIMKDHFDRVPETMRLAKSVKSVMHQNFGIWAVTNIIGLALVTFGFLGPAGAATYNFLTDFLPIGNALRAGRSNNSHK